MALQERLASEVTLLVHGEQGVEKAKRITSWATPGHKTELTREFFEALSKEVKPVMAPLQNSEGKKWVDLLVEWGFFASKGDVRRMIKNGGLTLNEAKIADSEKIFTREELFEGKWLFVGVGKKNKFLVEFLLEGKSES
jgi:tyrosyl-tRNA synthetase